MPKIYVYTITRANTPERCKLLLDTLTIGRGTAGIDFHWHIHVNGRATMAQGMVESAYTSQIVNSYKVSQYNEGQHLPTNAAIAEAISGGYDYIVRVDDDVEWVSKRWLAKLVEASQKLGDDKVLSPMVKGLRWQPPQTNQVEVEQIPVKFVDGPIGGICRLIPTKVLVAKPYISDVRAPMGGGDAIGVGNWAIKQEPLTFICYCQHIKVRHAKSTDGQVVEDPKHFEKHALLQHIPFIPIWKRNQNEYKN